MPPAVVVLAAQEEVCKNSSRDLQAEGKTRVIGKSSVAVRARSMAVAEQEGMDGAKQEKGIVAQIHWVGRSSTCAAPVPKLEIRSEVATFPHSWTGTRLAFPTDCDQSTSLCSSPRRFQ